MKTNPYLLSSSTSMFPLSLPIETKTQQRRNQNVVDSPKQSKQKQNHAFDSGNHVIKSQPNDDPLPQQLSLS